MHRLKTETKKNDETCTKLFSELVNAKIKNPLVSNPTLIFYECLLFLLFLNSQVMVETLFLPPLLLLMILLFIKYLQLLKPNVFN